MAEDPDSYVQKFGGDAFNEYTARESKDFILFKTQLLLAETKGDPVKKSGLIKDIVASIAKIPDPIKRNVYLRECATLLDVSEQALVNECNKLIVNAVRKREEKIARTPEAASDSPDRAPNPEQPVEDPTFARVQEKPMLRGDEFQERDIVRLLMQFGNHRLVKENLTVGEYIFDRY